MNEIRTALKRLQISGRENGQPETFVEWPFFLILSFAFGFVYIQSIVSSTALREPVRLILFTFLMGVHILLHWSSARLRTWNWVAPYLIVQSLLAFVIVSMAANIGALLGLYIGLIGESVGLLREKPRWTAAAVTLFLVLSFVNYGLLENWKGWFWWLLAMGPLTFFVAVYVTLYSHQAEARQRAQTLLKELESANLQLSEYAARVEDLSIANERQRMAREFHDTLSQGLAGLILQLEAVDANLAGNRPERARGILEQSMESARETLSKARLAIENLRQPAERDLVAAILQESGRFTDATGIACETQTDIKVDVPGPAAETAIRAISESLTNVARHSQAKCVKLQLSGVERELKIEICDDGVGFDPETVQPGHYGLVGMRERIRLAGGKFEINSAPEKGTRLVIRIPLAPIKKPDLTAGTPIGAI
jgi:two-component system, NarL family, sensor histidine kinase YdfH